MVVVTFIVLMYVVLVVFIVFIAFTVSTAFIQCPNFCRNHLMKLVYFFLITCFVSGAYCNAVMPLKCEGSDGRVAALEGRSGEKRTGP